MGRKGDGVVGSEGYERLDVRPWPVLAAGAALAVVIALTSWGVFGLFGGLETRAKGRDGIGHVRRIDAPPPGPQLQANPALEMEEHREIEARRTEEYGWVDREAGIVRVPIERAMELVLEGGLPARDRADAPPMEGNR